MKTKPSKRFSLEELEAHGWELLDVTRIPTIFFRKGKKELQTIYNGDSYRIIRIIKYDEVPPRVTYPYRYGGCCK